MFFIKNNQLARNWGFFLLGLAALCLFRVIYSVPIEFNGESIRKWEVARQLATLGNWEVLLSDHHQLRWGVILPQVVFSWLISDHWFGYYLTPMLFWSLVVVGSIRLFDPGSLILPVGLGYFIAVASEPLGHAMGSQFNSGAFGLLYVLCGIYALLGYVEKGRIGYLLLAALGFFCAYGAHLTFIVFAGAPIVFLLLINKDVRATAVFCIAFAILLGMEAVILYVLSDGGIQGGRMVEVARMKTWGDSMMGATHFRGQEPFELRHFIDRWRMLPKYSLAIGILFVVCSLSLLSPKTRSNIPDGVLLSFLVAGIYGIAVSFPIIGLNPIRLVLDLHSRYLAPFFPFAIVFIVWAFVFLLKSRMRSDAHLKGALYGLVLIGFAVFAWGSVSYRCADEVLESNKSNYSPANHTYCRFFRYSQEQNIYPSPDLFALNADSYYREFGQDYVTGGVALYGFTRIGAFVWFISAIYPDAKFIETKNGWFTVDGKEKPFCVKELGNFTAPSENYVDCIGLTMEPGSIQD